MSDNNKEKQQKKDMNCITIWILNLFRVVVFFYVFTARYMIVCTKELV